MLLLEDHRLMKLPSSQEAHFTSVSTVKLSTSPVCSAAAADAGGSSDSTPSSSEGFLTKYPALVTGFFFFMWYFLNVIFNILNKKIYNYFPYPYFVSVVHLFAGVVCGCVSGFIFWGFFF
ncbi:hypothetical protein KP509_02G002800 [Ceratopteris richardii]|uniref:Sugar phosphate transporter domain-containing protein n=1 Tax=Ceratopteris richardii TaxID=49495 RepID=A0A8T2V6G4_CERRI|nr:hypothetical protein KP509_02G002800 [Ceratopteris richardii]